MITDFLLARIDEDASRRLAYWHTLDCPVADGVLDECSCGSQARILAECEAKRRIVMAHSTDDGFGEVMDPSCSGTYDPGYEYPEDCATLRALAAVYADHPDYNEAWR